MILTCFHQYRQVEGKDGLKKLFAKIRVAGPPALFHGSLAAAAATFVGHYPWFFVYNYLSENLPRSNDFVTKLARSALIGFCASAVSDTFSNSIRVIKVYKQANTENVSYPEALRRVIKEDGLSGLFGRGLKTKIIANGLQGLMFSVLWKLIDDKIFKKEEKK
jgi:Mitochondrial carrier protein